MQGSRSARNHQYVSCRNFLKNPSPASAVVGFKEVNPVTSGSSWNVKKSGTSLVLASSIYNKKVCSNVYIKNSSPIWRADESVSSADSLVKLCTDSKINYMQKTQSYHCYAAK